MQLYSSSPSENAIILVLKGTTEEWPKQIGTHSAVCRVWSMFGNRSEVWQALLQVFSVNEKHSWPLLNYTIHHVWQFCAKYSVILWHLHHTQADSLCCKILPGIMKQISPYCHLQLEMLVVLLKVLTLGCMFLNGPLFRHSFDNDNP